METGLTRRIGAAAALLGLSLLAGGWTAAAEPALPRYPTASRDAIAFVARGDLWSAPLTGGTARRLLANFGELTAPHMSPDGRWIAFSARRAGGRDVYVLPAAGDAEPRRLTFDLGTGKADDLVLGWTPDGASILFLSGRQSPIGQLRAYAVPQAGGLPQPLPLDRAGLLSYSPDGHLLAYDRNFRNLDLNKRYTGGRAGKLYVYDTVTRSAARITDWKGTDTAPMWFGTTIYFLSDRDAAFRANIWAYDTERRTVRQVTHFNDFDIDWPSLAGNTITFQQGGKLYALDLPSEHLREVAVDVPDDGARTRPRAVPVGRAARAKDALGGIDYAIGDDGTLFLSARGDLIGLPLQGDAAAITATPGIDEDHPSPSPDGRWLAYMTDESGEQQLAVRPLPAGAARTLTRWTGGYRFTPLWSPQGDRLAVAAADHTLWLVPVRDGAPLAVAADPHAAIRDAAFSPDGKWLAYSVHRDNGLRAIHLFEIASRRDVTVSAPAEDDWNPVFTADGRLAFLSKRHEQPFVSDRGDESLIGMLNSDGVYIAPLMPIDGLMARAVPAASVTPAVIAALHARGNALFYLTQPPQLIGGDLAGQTGALHRLDLEDGTDRVVAEGADDMALSAGGAWTAYRRDGKWHVRATMPDAEDHQVDLSLLRVTVDPRREWAEMIDEAWRLDRDVFFSRSMNGTDWPKVREAYRRFVPLLSSQDDFLYLLGQVQGELATSHAFMLRGEESAAAPPEAAPLLGADYALDAASGRYRLARIYRGDNSRPQFRGPLGAPGVTVREGDYLMAIDGRDLHAPQTPAELLLNGKGQVTLDLADSPDGARRSVTVDPIRDETRLRRLDWIERNRAQVSRQSQGRLGYLYLSDFNDEGAQEFVRQFYAQTDKDGLVIDVRGNRGGFISQSILEILRREPAGVFVNREAALAPLPDATAPRAMVTLLNQASGSDGDQFPYFFRRFGLGPLVGTRSWGGVQGINAPWRLVDGSGFTIPKDALADLDGGWVIENEGVAPDIEIDAAPDEAATGGDAQLDAAIAAALDRLGRMPRHPIPVPPAVPAYPPGGDVPGAHMDRR